MAGIQCCFVSLWQFPFYILLSNTQAISGVPSFVRNFSMKDRLEAPYPPYSTEALQSYYIISLKFKQAQVARTV